MRKSGIEVLGNVPWRTHFCQFYQTKEDLTDILIPYFKSGLENNEFCFWVTSQPSGAEEAKDALRMAVPDIDDYLEKGQIEITSCNQGHANEGAFDSEKVISEKVINDWVIKLNRALTNGFSGLRAAVNISWLKEGHRDNFANYENKVNSVIGKYQTITLYPYFLKKASTADIIDAAPSHQFILTRKDGKWGRIENSRWKNITGGKRTGETQQKNWQDLESRITSESEIRWICEKADLILDNNVTLHGDFYTAQDIAVGRKAEEEVPSRTERFIRPELDSIFSSDREMVNLELADIIDTLEIQSLMDDFYRFAHISMALVDLKGNVLVGVGWQEICTRFHRVHPETFRHCVESDTRLSAGVLPGEFKLYRCRNNMWDIATPIMVGGQHIGNIFSGQFFFETETLNYELFRAQARKYGFNEEEYIAALEKVPRLKRETVNAGMNFLIRLANMISQLSYSNIKLSRSLVERDALVNSLRESKEKYRSVVETANEGIWIIDAEDRTIYVNKKMADMLGYAQHEMIGRSEWDFTDEKDEAVSRINLEKRKQGIDVSHEFKFIRKDGSSLWTLVNTKSFFDKDGKFTGSMGMLTDITERKRVEEALAFERSQLLSIFDGIDDVVYVSDPYTHEVLYANKAMKEKFGIEFVGGLCYQKFQRRDSPCDFCTNHIILKEKGKPYHWEYHNTAADRYFMIMDRIIKWPDGRDVRFEIAKDITERKKTEEALKKAYDYLEEKIEERTVQLEKAYKSLKESEEGLSEAQKLAHIGNWEWDIAADKAYWSEEMYRIFGRDPEKPAPSYNEYFNYIHPDDRDFYCAAIKKAEKGKPFGIDYRIVQDNGEESIVHLKSEFVMNDKNISVRIKGIVQDITERKKSEEKIQVLANIVESSNDAIGTLSLDGIITSWNKGAEQVYGYSAKEILGKAGSTLSPPHLSEEMKKLSELIKQGKKIHYHETLRLRKDGKIIHASITLSPVFDSHGKLTAISFISRDITERKRVEEKLRESEEKYRNIVETANEGIFIIDAENIVTYANKKMTDMLGYTLEEVIGREIWDFVSEKGKDIVKLNQERRKQGINESYELKLICKGVSSLWALVSAKSLFDKDSRFMGSISMLTDITKRKEAEEALANIEIARKKEIHHRIKNNLQVISSLLDLQAEKFNNKEDIKDSEVLEAFRESQDRVISMALIHEELYKGGGLDTLNFSSYIEELAENLFQTYRLGNADIQLNMELEENIFFDMDVAVPLGIIVNELVSNSLKHAFTENVGEIRIQFYRKEKSDKTNESLFSLIISDNGQGIPENIKLENIETLGLKLVSILVDQLNGNLKLKREHGTGFRIFFKVVESS
ncbi:MULTISPECIES: PAS domain S-box protein [unclassified Methanosarcina]|uniref:PAS domain S-box protein n=1 Tax=unclassified Methanosarcina TaxID=2644672 RepID=UPI001F3CDE66|nr:MULTISPECIES: PAS domain S-box protein [unclassified Methanosarcina]